MTEQNARPVDAPPVLLRAVRVILYVQAAATLLGLAAIAVEVMSRIDHGQDVPGITYVLGIVSLVAAVVAAACAATIVSQGRLWVRRTVMGLEVVTIIYGVINIVYGAFAGVGEIVIAILVMVLLGRPDVGEWIEGDVGARP